MLQLQNFQVSRGNQIVLHHLDFEISRGELVVLIGPNGSGKSTFTKALMGNLDLQIGGKAIIEPHDFYKLSSNSSIHLSDYNSSARSWLGFFSTLQNPPAIDGVSLKNLIKACVEQNRQHRGQTKLSGKELLEKIKHGLKQLNLNTDFLEKIVGKSMSGGEKKRSEMLQSILLEPKLIIFDELDSGLDIDGMKLALKLIKNNRQKSVSQIVITHSLDFAVQLEPDKVFRIDSGSLTKLDDLSLINQQLK